MDWFKHKTNANRDTKLRKLRLKYGMAGYGLYWYLIEHIAEPVDASHFTFQLEDDSELVSGDVGISRELVEEMMAYMVKLKLFEESEGVITCMKLARMIAASGTSNPKMRTLIKNINSGVAAKASVKPKKVRARFVKPTVDEVTAYIIDAKLSINADAFVDYYESKGWVIGSASMKDWKATARNWHRRDNPTKAKVDYSDYV